MGNLLYTKQYKTALAGNEELKAFDPVANKEYFVTLAQIAALGIGPADGSGITTTGGAIDWVGTLNKDAIIDADAFDITFMKDVESFDMSVGFNSYLGSRNSLALQTDGKIIAVGDFTTFNGTTVNKIVRLTSTGEIDTDFLSNNGTGFNDDTYAVALQTDSKMVVVGRFSSFNGTSINDVIRLNSNGSEDTAFTANLGSASNDRIYSVAVQTDGKVLLGGSFTSFNGTSVNRLIRLNSDGTEDTTFTTNIGTAAGGEVSIIKLQSDGKILLGGYFTSFNGTSVNRFVRLNSDGTEDTTFTTNIGTAANSNVNNIGLQTDGKILLTGGFTDFNGTTINRLIRLNADGTEDTAFTANLGTAASDGASYGVFVQADGKILVGGTFSVFNGSAALALLRLNADGTRDIGFTGYTTASDEVYSFLELADNRLVIGGNFNTFNGATSNYLARTNADGTSALTDEVTVTLGDTGFVYGGEYSFGDRNLVDKAFVLSAVASGSFTLADGEGTTVNGSAVDLGGTSSDDVDIEMLTNKDFTFRNGVKYADNSVFLTMDGGTNSILLQCRNTSAAYLSGTIAPTTLDIGAYNDGASTGAYYNVDTGGFDVRAYTSTDTMDFQIASDSIKITNLPSGATQVAAGASADELWVTSSHATLPDGVVMIGL